MSGKGKSSTKSSLSAPVSKSSKAGLIFPVGRIGRWMKDGSFAQRIGVGASVYLAAVLEYMTSEVLEMAGSHAKESGKQRITPQHLQYAVRRDRELAELLANVTIVEGGVLPTTADLHSMKKKSSKVKLATDTIKPSVRLIDEDEDDAF